MKIVVGNFKAELGYTEMKQWLDDFAQTFPKEGIPDTKVILCPSASHIYLTKEKLSGYAVSIGAQNISHIEKGTYTGEVTAASLTDLAEFVIIGHSERRRLFQDRFDRIQDKIDLANKYDLSVILCSEEPERYRGMIYALAYEPSSAIGSGHPMTPEDAAKDMEKIKMSIHASYYLYGGSVDKTSVHSYCAAGFHGVLVGKKTLDPSVFSELVKNA